MKTIYEAVLEGRPIANTPFIDVHGHFGNWQCTYIPYATDYERTIGEMDRYGCNMMWMTASEPGWGGDMAKNNDQLFDFAERYPNRIIPYCTLSSNRPTECLKELKRCLKRGCCIGVKMHRYCQPSYTLKTDFVQPVLELLEEHRLVYMNHVLSCDDPGSAALKWALKRYPKLTFIDGHFNFTTPLLGKTFTNLFDCTCAGTGADMVESEVGKIGTSRTLLVGSDFNLFSMSFGVGMVAYARLPEKDKQNILGIPDRVALAGFAIVARKPGSLG